MRYAAALCALLVLAAMFAAGGAGAQRSGNDFATIGDTRDALALALRQQQLAQRRAEQLEAAASSATEQVEQTRAEAAALASRLQETEAALAAASARVAIADLQYGAIRARIAERQRPLIGLTATLQNFTRRPVAIAVLRPRRAASEALRCGGEAPAGRWPVSPLYRRSRAGFRAAALQSPPGGG